MDDWESSFTKWNVLDVEEGEVFAFRGKRYKLEKKRSTAIAVSRWYWFDDFGQWLGRKLGQ